MSTDPNSWIRDPKANPLDSQYDDWTGDPAADRAAFVTRALVEIHRFDALYGNGEEHQGAVVEESPPEADRKDRPRRWLRRRPK